MDVVRKLILEKLEGLRLTMSEASIKIGRNHAYLQQFLKRGVPLELGEKERGKLAELLGVPENELRGTSAPLPKREYNKLSAAVADPPRAAFRSDSGHNLLDSHKPAAQLYLVDRDLPVYGTAQGGQGALVVTDRAIDWIARPAALARVEDAYGMIATGESMSPKIENGDTIAVHPHLPPKSGDTCVFRRHMDDGTVLVIVKYLRRATDDTWYVRQFNPRKDFSLKRSDWQICHVVTDIHLTR